MFYSNGAQKNSRQLPLSFHRFSSCELSCKLHRLGPGDMGVSMAMGVSQKWLVFVRENPMNIDDKGGTPILGSPQVIINPYCKGIPKID